MQSRIQVQAPKAQPGDGQRPSQQLPHAVLAVSFQPLGEGRDLPGEAPG